MTINFSRGGTESTQEAAAVGSGTQTWSKYSVGSTRSNNTWYQNTTGRPIQIAIGLFTSRHIHIGPSTSNYVEVVHTGSDHSEAMNGAIIPQGHYYRTDGRRTWTEFR